MASTASVHFVCAALLVMGASGCVGEDWAEPQAQEYEVGQRVYFASLGSSSNSGTTNTQFTSSQASLTVESLDCHAVTGRNVMCQVNVTGLGGGSSQATDYDWSATLTAGNKSVQFGSSGQRTGSSGKAYTLRDSLDLSIEEPNGSVQSSLQVKTQAKVAGQALGESRADRELKVTFTLSPPGKQGIPYTPQPVSG